uniref:Polyketide synthase n=1 Tax=Peronospora matthiolae TaxID=2874970 RepID=A0AAV1TG68_9STRA
MAQDIAVPGLLSGVSMNTYSSVCSVSRVASLVVMHRGITTTTTRPSVIWNGVRRGFVRRIARSKELGRDSPMFPDPVNRVLAVPAPRVLGAVGAA